MVGNTSEMKICEEFPASWDGEDHSESDRQHHRLAPRIGPEQLEQGGEKKGGDSFVRITRWPGRGGAEKAQRSIE